MIASYIAFIDPEYTCKLFQSQEQTLPSLSR
jgi:hypothetical protein